MSHCNPPDKSFVQFFIQITRFLNFCFYVRIEAVRNYTNGFLFIICQIRVLVFSSMKMLINSILPFVEFPDRIKSIAPRYEMLFPITISSALFSCSLVTFFATRNNVSGMMQPTILTIERDEVLDLQSFALSPTISTLALENSGSDFEPYCSARSLPCIEATA